MSSHALTLFLQRKTGNAYKLMSNTPIFHDFMGLLERITDNPFDYLSKLENVDKKSLPAAIKKYMYVDGHNFYIIEIEDFYTELQQIIEGYNDELKCLCKALGFTKTVAADGEEIILGVIRGNSTLPVNADLVAECIRKRNKAMNAEYIQGLIQAWLSEHDHLHYHMNCFRFIAAYDF